MPPDFNDNDWNNIANFLPGRKFQVCKDKWIKSHKQSPSKSTWSNNDDEKIFNAFMRKQSNLNDQEEEILPSHHNKGFGKKQKSLRGHLQRFPYSLEDDLRLVQLWKIYKR